MGTKVYVEDFNPKSGCWNRTGIFNSEDFDTNTTFPSKYGGVVRIRYVDEVGKVLQPIAKEVVKEILEIPGAEKVFEKAFDKVRKEEKVLTEEISSDNMETEEVVKPRKKKFFN